MTDVVKIPEPHNLGLSEPSTIPTLDGWIENLVNCKQLAESEVRRLCDKVNAMQVSLKNQSALLWSFALSVIDRIMQREC